MGLILLFGVYDKATCLNHNNICGLTFIHTSYDYPIVKPFQFNLLWIHTTSTDTIRENFGNVQ